MTQPPRPDHFGFLPKRSKTAALIRAFDWQSTGLGPLQQWSETLRGATSLMLRCEVPMTLQWGRQGWLLYNDAYIALAGSRHPDVLGKTVSDSWPEVAEFRRQALHRVLDGHALSYRDQHLLLRRDEAPVELWVDLAYSPVADAHGVVKGVLAIVNDVSARFQTAERLRIAQEAGRVGTFELFPQSGRLEVSDQYRRIWGLDPAVEVTVELLASLVHPDDRHAVGPHRASLPDRLVYAEYRRVDPATGEVRWLARRGEAIATAGGARRYVGIVIDITERKRTEAALAASEARWQSAIERLDIKQIRHRNVRTLVRDLERDSGRRGKRAGGLVMLAQMLDKSSAQVCRFAAEKPTTPIGDRVAREIEQAFEREHGWMDHVHGNAPADDGET